jgi:hypothetical protein
LRRKWTLISRQTCFEKEALLWQKSAQFDCRKKNKNLEPTNPHRVSVSHGVFTDQFQRNGVILGQRFGVRNGDTGAVSRGGARRLLVAS